MPVKANATGAIFGERIVEVTPRMMLAYAAAIGETGAATFDDADSRAFLATPPFCVSLEWPSVSEGSIHALLGATQQERLQTLHVGQDSFFHRPVSAGQRLRIHGTVMAIRATRSGAITVSKLETVDDSSGEPVVTSWTTALMRGVAVEGEHPPLAGPPGALGGVSGSPQATPITVARELPHIYSECSGIWNPIHTERKVAQSVGLPDIILHGTASWALAGREIIRLYADGDPRRLRRLGGRFGAIVIPGTTISLEHEPSPRASGSVVFRVLNSEGAEAILEGIAEIDPS